MFGSFEVAEAAVRGDKKLAPKKKVLFLLSFKKTEIKLATKQKVTGNSLNMLYLI